MGCAVGSLTDGVGFSSERHAQGVAEVLLTLLGGPQAPGGGTRRTGRKKGSKGQATEFECDFADEKLKLVSQLAVSADLAVREACPRAFAIAIASAPTTSTATSAAHDQVS